MSGETEANVSGWTVDTLMAFSTMQLRYERELSSERDKRYLEQQKADDRFNVERDRRYTEVKNAEEKALKIKEEADKTALGLQRETQTYKDEKANELREQISSERGLYATKLEMQSFADKGHAEVVSAVSEIRATLTPMLNFISQQQGNATGKITTQQLFMMAIPALIVMLITIIGAVVGVAYAIRP